MNMRWDVSIFLFLYSSSSWFLRSWNWLEIWLFRNRTLKRWGVLYIYIFSYVPFSWNWLTSLPYTDFLLFFVKFVTMYRSPEVLHSNNGINFVGLEREINVMQQTPYASKELPRFELREWNRTSRVTIKTLGIFSDYHTNFFPAHASRFGAYAHHGTTAHPERPSYQCQLDLPILIAFQNQPI